MSSATLNMHNFENSHSLEAGCFLSLSVIVYFLRKVAPWSCSPSDCKCVPVFFTIVCVCLHVTSWAMLKTFLLNAILGDFANMYWHISVFIKCGLLHQTICVKTNMCVCVQLEGYSLKFTRARKRTILTEVVEKNETHILCLIHFIHNLVIRLNIIFANNHTLIYAPFVDMCFSENFNIILSVICFIHG